MKIAKIIDKCLVCVLSIYILGCAHSPKPPLFSVNEKFLPPLLIEVGPRTKGDSSCDVRANGGVISRGVKYQGFPPILRQALKVNNDVVLLYHGVFRDPSTIEVARDIWAQSKGLGVNVYCLDLSTNPVQMNPDDLIQMEEVRPFVVRVFTDANGATSCLTQEGELHDAKHINQYVSSHNKNAVLFLDSCAWFKSGEGSRLSAELASMNIKAFYAGTSLVFPALDDHLSPQPPLVLDDKLWPQ